MHHFSYCTLACMQKMLPQRVMTQLSYRRTEPVRTNLCSPQPLCSVPTNRVCVAQRIPVWLTLWDHILVPAVHQSCFTFCFYLFLSSCQPSTSPVLLSAFIYSRLVASYPPALFYFLLGSHTSSLIPLVSYISDSGFLAQYNISLSFRLSACLSGCLC